MKEDSLPQIGSALISFLQNDDVNTRLPLFATLRDPKAGTVGTLRDWKVRSRAAEAGTSEA